MTLAVLTGILRTMLFMTTEIRTIAPTDDFVGIARWLGPGLWVWHVEDIFTEGIVASGRVAGIPQADAAISAAIKEARDDRAAIARCAFARLT